MIKLVIIADDLTGALDTGVQFAGWGASVTLATADNLPRDMGAIEGDVFVIDGEMRHKAPEEAYAIVHALTKSACAGGIRHLYIKTDSGLRGNIAAEFAAVLDASGQAFLPFVPAFPNMRRITRGGIHYIDGKPLAQSMFAADPYTPVHSSDLREILAPCRKKVTIIPRAQQYDDMSLPEGVAVFDAETNDDLARIAAQLSAREKTALLAGCAGFAAVLPDMIGLKKRFPAGDLPRKPLLVFSGSISPVTRAQLEYGESIGYARITIEPECLLEKGWFAGENAAKWLEEHAETLRGTRPVMLETGASEPERMQALLPVKGLSREEARGIIADNLGALAKAAVDAGYAREKTLMIIGGDSLQGFMRHLDWEAFSPLREVEPGTVLSMVRSGGETLHILSKSGGFGDKDELRKIQAKICGEEGEAHDKLHA